MKKQFAVDVHLDYAHCFNVEAESKEEAEKIVADKIRNRNFFVDDFEMTDDWEVECSGEADENGKIQYYY